MRTFDHARRTLSLAVVMACLTGLSASTLTAQQGPDTRWQAWLGCWQPTIATPEESTGDVDGASAAAAMQPQMLVDSHAAHICVVPSSQGNSAVDIVTVSGDTVTSRHHIEASGARVVVHDQGCDGWESAQWSADNRRVYLHSQLTCSGGVSRASDGLLGMASNGDWLDAQSVNTGYGSAVKVMRYRDVGLKSPPAALAAALAQEQQERLAVGTSRAAVGSAIGPRDVEDASRMVSAPVVQAWLAARHQPFALDAKTLEHLASAGVPGSVTDVMVALSYPQRFSLGAGNRARQYAYDDDGYLDRADSARIADQYMRDQRLNGLYDPFGWDYYGPYGYAGYGYNPYGPYGYAPYPYYAGNPYGYGTPAYGWYYNSPAVVVVQGQRQPHGRAVNGSGYTRGDGQSTGGAARPRDQGSTASRNANGSGSTSSGGGSSNTGSSSTGSSGGKSAPTGNVAHKKPPI